MDGKMGAGHWILIIAVVLLVVVTIGDKYGGLYDKVMGTEKVPLIPESNVPSGQCIGVDTTVYTVVIDDKYAAGSDIYSAGDHAIAIFVDGIKKDSKYASGDSMTLSPGQKIDGYLYDDTKDDTLITANTQKWSFIVPCKGTKDDLIKTLDYGTAGASAAAWPTDGTAVILSDTYADVTGATAGYDIPAGGSKCLGKFELSYTNNKGYGSPDGKNCIVFAANKTLVKKLEFTGTGVEDVNCKPDGFSETILTTSTGFTAGQIEYYDYQIPIFDDNKPVTFGLCIEYENNQNGVASAETDDLTFQIFDQQWFYNALEGKMELGYEDEDNTLIGSPSIGQNITLA